MVALAALLAGGGAVAAQTGGAVPMLFTGTVTVDGRPVATGTVVEVYSAAGEQLGSTTTGAQGQAAHEWTLVLFAPRQEDRDVYFYVRVGGQLLPAPGQAPIAVRYDAEGGRGRALVPIAVTTPPPMPAGPTAFQAAFSMDALQITWRDNATDETAYELWRWDEVAGWLSLGMLAANASSSVDRNVAAGRTYWYYLAAVNAAG